MRRRLPALLTAIVVAALYLAVMELALRFLPVATGLRSVAVDDAQPIFHYEPDRSFVYSTGWRMRHVNRGRVNNAGWVNDQDYGRDHLLPLIAVIGDSYIEAEMVPYAETMQGRLAAALAGRFRVYSVAAAGAPLSEFLVYARYAVRELGASAIVFNIANYDFAGSDSRFAKPLGMWVYDGDADDGMRGLRLIPYRPSGLRVAVRHSALLRYLVLNLRLGRQVAAAKIAALPLGIPNANAAGGAPSDRDAAASRVVADFFRDLPAYVDLPPERALFLMDGDRYPERAGVDAGELRGRREFTAAAGARGYEAVDLDPLFFAHHRRDGSRFEVPTDRHWNAEGHAVAAEGVLSSRLLARLGASVR